MTVDASLDEEETSLAAEDAAELEEGEGGEGPGGFNAKKILLFIVLPLFLVVGAGGGLYFSGVLDGLFSKGGEEQADAGKGDVSSRGESGQVSMGGYFLEIPNMLVNLSSDDGQPRYLRLSVQLELESQADLQAVEGVMPRVVDQFQTYLRELRIKDLRGSAGMYRLQMELLSRVNAAAYPVEVKDVLFQEILIQ